jgi:hypothetical protein
MQRNNYHKTPYWYEAFTWAAGINCAQNILEVTSSSDTDTDRGAPLENYHILFATYNGNQTRHTERLIRQAGVRFFLR